MSTFRQDNSRVKKGRCLPNAIAKKNGQQISLLTVLVRSMEF